MLRTMSVLLTTFVSIFTLMLAGCGGSGGSGAGSVTNSEAITTQMGGALQGKALALSGLTETFAGASLVGSQDGTGTAARFNWPSSITSDGTNLYVSDTYNHTIRKIVIATGMVTTLAGSPGSYGSADGTGAAARFNYPSGITTDGTNLYVADSENNIIRKVVIATGTVTTLAGTAQIPGSTDGTGATALFSYPYGITMVGTNLYVTDGGNQTIRKISVSTGAVTTIAGSVGEDGSANGIGTAARFFNPSGITSDTVNLYVADAGNSDIRKIVIATGEVTTIAGTAGQTGSDDAAGSFAYPLGITTDGVNLYVADTGNSTIRKVVIATGTVTTIAGSAISSGATDGIGNAAQFNFPSGITVTGNNLYILDENNNAIRKIEVITGAVTTIAGSLGSSASTDGTAATARFNKPEGLTTDGTNLFVADTYNHTVRKVVIATGAVTTIAGSAGSPGSTDGNGTSARFDLPSGITTDGIYLYVTDMNNQTVRKIVPSTGEVTTLAGTAGASGSTDDTGVAARFTNPRGITTDGTNLYVADSGNQTIRKIVIATGAVTTIAGTAGSYGSGDGIGATARFATPYGITTDGTNLYITDKDSHTIRKVVIATAAVTTIAGTAGTFGSAGGTGAAAQFAEPNAVTTDGTSLYIADTNNQTVRRLVLASGAVTTIAGKAGFFGSTDGTGAAARFGLPSGITTDGKKLFLLDNWNNTIRTIM